MALTLDERLQRTRVFLDAGDAKVALAELDRSETNGLVRDPGARAEVALLRAQAFFALNRAEDAEEALVVAAAGPPATAAEAMLVRARRLLKLDEHTKAIERLQEISKRFAGEPASEEADYFLGWLALQEGKLQAAAEALESFEKRHPESRRRDEACWFRALAQIRSGNWIEADRAIRELQDRYPRSNLVPQAKYWRVRVKQLAGGKPVDDYQDILKLYPQTFYGLLAQERLRELGAKPEPIFTERPRLSPKVVAAPELALPRALASAGLWRESGEELRARLGAVHTPEAALRVGTALARVGEAWAAYHLANRLLWGKAYAQKDPAALALLYPRPYVSHVDETARMQGVHPSLLYAIMRRESAFQPDRLSAARARGLMQLMARTASAIARELQRDPPEPDELYRPELNLDLSAWYVGQLAKRFVHPALIAAAYNAGPAVTLKWTSELGSMPVDLFVESMPFKETRAYVKQVVADDYLYQALLRGRGGATAGDDAAEADFHRDRVLGLDGGPGSQERPTGSRVRADAVLEHDLSADHHQVEPERIREGSLERRRVDHPGRIEDDQIGERAGANDSEVRHAEALRRERGHLPDGLLQGEETLLAHVASEDARGCPERPGVRPPGRERPVDGGRAPVRADGGPGLHEGEHQVVLGPELAKRHRIAPVAQHELDERGGG